jgi:hypothetical protein
VLDLVDESKVSGLLAGQRDSSFEASGVVAVDDIYYVIFDNRPEIGRIGAGLSAATEGNGLVPQQGRAGDYEDIAFDPVSKRFFLLVEALPRKGGFMAKVREFDQSFRRVSSSWLDFPLRQPNKGMEGLTCLRRNGELFLLVLCEGNRCRAGAAGRRPGGGRIQVFAHEGTRIHRHVATIRLPSSLPFKDYSSLAVANDRLCIVSQTASAVWVGQFSPSSSWALVDDGFVYGFPLDQHGKTVYCNVEGVCWIGEDCLVFVSDRMKTRSQKRRCKSKDQSIHIFRLPGETVV